MQVYRNRRPKHTGDKPSDRSGGPLGNTGDPHKGPSDTLPPMFPSKNRRLSSNMMKHGSKNLPRHSLGPDKSNRPGGRKGRPSMGKVSNGRVNIFMFLLTRANLKNQENLQIRELFLSDTRKYIKCIFSILWPFS